jgi:hypothetical protein
MSISSYSGSALETISAGAQLVGGTDEGPLP